MERLNTDRSIGPLVAQFVPLKIETDAGDNWGTWSRKYAHEGNGIPIIFVIRADGEKLYGKTGSLGDQLPQFLVAHLSSAGKILSPAQLTQVQTAVDEAKKAIESGDAFTAVKRLDSLKRLGPTGNLGSYATAALEADKLVAQLMDDGKAALTAAKEQLHGEDKLAGALGVLSANRIYGTLPELKKDLGTAERELRKDGSLKEVVAQAEAIDKALALASTKGGKTAAADAMSKVAARFPNTPAATLAQEKLASLSNNASASAKAGDEDKYRIWTDVTGTFKVEAELVEATGTEVMLRLKKDGKTVNVPLEKLSEKDREFLKTQQ